MALLTQLSACPIQLRTARNQKGCLTVFPVETPMPMGTPLRTNIGIFGVLQSWGTGTGSLVGVYYCRVHLGPRNGAGGIGLQNSPHGPSARTRRVRAAAGRPRRGARLCGAEQGTGGDPGSSTAPALPADGVSEGGSSQLRGGDDRVHAANSGANRRFAHYRAGGAVGRDQDRTGRVGLHGRPPTLGSGQALRLYLLL